MKGRDALLSLLLNFALKCVTRKGQENRVGRNEITSALASADVVNLYINRNVN
jgi:hypothetical protein